MISLNKETEQINNLWKSVDKNQYAIGKILQKIKEEKIYKQDKKYTEFDDYISDPKNKFKFHERYAYALIQVVKNFSAIDCTKYGITRCIYLCRINEADRKKFIEDNKIETLTVKQLNDKIPTVKKGQTNLPDYGIPVDNVKIGSNVEPKKEIGEIEKLYPDEFDTTVGLDGIIHLDETFTQKYNGKHVKVYIVVLN